MGDQSDVSQDNKLKLREPRRKALIRARMRTGSAWVDINLLNLSTRGALAQTAMPPPRGTYIEVRRGSHRITARVVWTEERRFGFVTQDPIAIDDVISEPECSDRKNQSCNSREIDSRLTVRKPDISDEHDRNRLWARSMEFCLVGLVGGIFAYIAFGLVYSVMSAPISQVQSALSGSSETLPFGGSSL